MSNTPDPENSRTNKTNEAGQEKLAELDRLRNEILSSSPEIVIANHCFGLFELAAIYLSDSPPRLRDATLAIDALAGLAGSIKGRLGEYELEILDGISQLRLAFVQMSTLSTETAKTD
ncbi:MAG: hypothetical protein HKL84_06240 [Acidimicrobiaceae bacterium]|nr:hypothetical protein [Acidimicrobiaceae bacterium]